MTTFWEDPLLNGIAAQALFSIIIERLHLPPSIFHSPAYTRMHGEDDGHLVGDVVQGQATWSGKQHAHWLQSASEWVQDQPENL